MRIDQKYFKPFLIVLAIVGALIIAYFTISSPLDREAAFREQIVKQDSLKTTSWLEVETSDSLRISDFSGQYVMLYFWSQWSGSSDEGHQKIAELRNSFTNDLEVISAMVGLRKEEALAFVSDNDFPFHYVAGSKQFSAFGVPGLPAHLLYNPDGKIQYISLGILNEAEIDSLSTIINDG